MVGLGFCFLWNKYGGDKATLQSGCLINGGEFNRILNHAFDYLKTQFPVGVFAASEHERNLYAVAVFNKFFEVAHFCIVVMVAHVDVVFDFFELGLHLVLFLFFLFLFLIIFVFAVIHDSANRWLGGGGYFHQVQSVFMGTSQCVACFYDTHFRSIVVKQPDFRYADAVVDSNLRRALLSTSEVLLSNLKPPFLVFFCSALLL